MIFLSILGCTLTENISDNEYTSNDLNELRWGNDKTSSVIILAIHGYNDYSKSFEQPANFFKKFNFLTIAIDLQGFGKNPNSGEWYPLESHIKDLKNQIIKIKKAYPKQKIYLMGESMGGAIVISLINSTKNLPIDGCILIAPAIWNFKERNFFKSITLNFISKVLPNLTLDGKGFVDVQASDNLAMLKKLSEDPLFIHKPKLKSLNGITILMDQSFVDAKNYLKDPSYNTLILVPINDQIVPRKPLIEILKKPDIKKNIGQKFDLSVHVNSYHMMLRDLNGDLISNEIKEWILDNNNVSFLNSFKNPLETLINEPYYHILD